MDLCTHEIDEETHTKDECHAVSPERVTSILQQHTIVLRYLLGKIGEEWNIEPPQPSLRTGDLNPGQMGVLGVYRTCHHFSIDGSEFVHAVAEGNDLSWTHKCTAVRKLNNYMYGRILVQV